MPALLDPKLDVVFKLMFAAERSRALLVSLLEAVLRPARPIADIAVLNAEIVPDTLGDKSVVLDLLVRLDDGALVDVEMQTVSREGAPQRALYYWARMASSDLRRGEGFAAMRRAVVVLILGYRAIDGAPFHGVFRVREQRTGVELGDVLEIHTVELPKLGEVDPVAGDAEAQLVRWARFFRAKDEHELEELARMDEVMAQAKSILEELSGEPSAQEAARQRELGLFATRNAEYLAQERGRQEGRHQTLSDNVLAVLAARGIVLDGAARERVVGCRDAERLRRWLVRAATANAASEVLDD